MRTHSYSLFIYTCTAAPFLFPCLELLVPAQADADGNAIHGAPRARELQRAVPRRALVCHSLTKLTKLMGRVSCNSAIPPCTAKQGKVNKRCFICTTQQKLTHLIGND